MTEQSIYNKVSRYTMCGHRRTIATIRAVKHIIKNEISGDFIECGVWKGGQIMAMMITLNSYNKERDIYLYDTFEGIPQPQAWEKAIKNGTPALNKYNRLKHEDNSSGWCRSEIDEVKKNIFSISYNKDRIHFIKGMVEDTLPKSDHKKIALMRLDTDLYQSTKTELEILYPKVPSNGIIIIDDYGHWSGAKEAVDQYIRKNNLQLTLRIDDRTGRTIVKP